MRCGIYASSSSGVLSAGRALPLPALTLNSLGTMSFGVARPRKASRPQPSRMATTEEKSLSTLRT